MLTNRSPITLNVHLGSCNIGQLILDARALQVGALLLMIDNLNDAPKIAHVQAQLPGVLIVARCWHPEDYRFHEPGGDEGWVLSPRHFLDFFGFLGREGRVLYVLNEPSGYSNTARLVDWLLEVVRLARTREIRICLANFATGHPASWQGRDQEWDHEYDRLLVELHQSRYDGWVYLGLHEYGPGDNSRLGRFQQVAASCVRLGLRIPQIFVSEWGIDTEYAGDPHNGWRTRAITDEEPEYFNYLIGRYNRFYASSIRAGSLIGLAIFCYGDSGGWGNYRVDNARTFMDLLVKQGPKENIMVSVPTYPPLIATNDPRWQYGTIQRIGEGAGYIRTIPTVSSNTPLRVYIPIKPALARLAVAAEWGQWGQVEYEGVQGWTHLQYIRFDTGAVKLIPLTDSRWKSGTAQRVNNGAGNIRTLPSDQNNTPLNVKIPGIPTNVKFAKDAAWGKWGQILLNGVQGWTHLDYVRFVETLPIENPIKMLDVPFYSQDDAWSNRFRNDSGPACALMLVQHQLKQHGLKPMAALTVDRLAADTPLNVNDQPQSLSDITQLLDKYGVSNNYRQPLDTAAIRRELDADHPVIVWVRYKHIMTTGEDFGHFVVVVGYSNTGFWIHEPYRGGANFYVAREQFETALSDYAGSTVSKPYQGIALTAAT